MIIPADALIPPEKLTAYLLRRRSRNDKSKLLARIGFSAEAPEVLEAAIRRHAREGEASRDAQDVYGDHFVCRGMLIGPLGELWITSVWVRPTGTSSLRFVTLKPARRNP